MVQMRHTANRREPLAAENKLLQGFQLTRVRLSLHADYLDRAAVFVRAGTDAGASFNVERAYVDLHFGGTSCGWASSICPAMRS